MLSSRALQAVLLSARCLSTLPQIPQIAACSGTHLLFCSQNHGDVPAAVSRSAAAALSAPWGCSRGFFSHILQPESKVYKERRLIGYSPEQLYEVVSNVQHYSQFVPWCVGSHVLKRGQDGRYLEAELQIGFQMISERYTSKVNLQPPHTVSSTVADSALFHHLESTWQMRPGPSPNSTWLSFSVDFAFLNPLYANVAQLFFSEVVTRMMGAFEGRCQQLYGQPSFAAPGRSLPHHVHHPKQQDSRHLQHHGQHLQHHEHHMVQQSQQQQVVAAAAQAGGGAVAGQLCPQRSASHSQSAQRDQAERPLGAD